MKKLVMFIMLSVFLSSCSSIGYNTRHQSKVMQSFSKSRFKKGTRVTKRTVIAHPAVHPSTRKNLKQRITSN